MKTTWKTFEDTTRRGRNRSIKAQLVKDYYYYYYYYYTIRMSPVTGISSWYFS